MSSIIIANSGFSSNFIVLCSSYLEPPFKYTWKIVVKNVNLGIYSERITSIRFMMLFHCGLLLMFLSCVRTSESYYDNGIENALTDYKQSYWFWPEREKRQASSDVAGLNEGGGTVAVESDPILPVVNPGDSKTPVSSMPVTAPPVSLSQPQPQPQPQLPLTETKNPTKVVPTMSVVTAVNHTGAVNVHNNSTNTNGTLLLTVLPKHLNLQDSRVIMRGIIVFGGFMLLAVAYFVFYRKNSNKNETGNAHNTNDQNQFRYGVLKSDDRRDNLELSVPLTFESDEDDDEDLEIFDLGQKKKSLSYINLQTNDEDLVFPTRDKKEEQADKENLLLDIDDTGSETLINWSANSNNKSIL